MRRVPIIIAATGAALVAAHSIAQGMDANLARGLAATCANCHGPNGVSQGEVESLAGQKMEDLVRKMQEFKTGKRPATIMHQLAKGYTDEQIALIAEWFAGRKAK